MRSVRFSRAVTAVVLSIISLAAIACDEQPAPVSPATATPVEPQQMPALFGPGPVFPLDIELKLSAPSYGPRDVVRFDLTFTNKLERPVSLGSFPPDIAIEKPESREVVRWLSSGTRTTTVLEKGEHISHSWEWDQTDSAGAHVPNGRYLVAAERISIDTGESGWGAPYNQFIIIGDPAGNLVRTLEAGTRVDVGGAAIILDRIEFTAAETNLYARAIPPGYDFPGARDEGAAMPPMSVMPFQPAATYSVDGGPPKSAGGGGFNPRRHDLTLVWTFDPVPATARAFTFTVTTIGRWDGPWVFTIVLE